MRVFTYQSASYHFDRLLTLSISVTSILEGFVSERELFTFVSSSSFFADLVPLSLSKTRGFSLTLSPLF